MEMDERKKKVLLAIIKDYISTAEPVGSRTISRKYNLGVSPATIRNEMADLEELGYIEQPHTSAGRVPSHLGYRYYVDYLMEPLELNKEELELINRSYENKVREIGKIITKTGKLLSRLTNYTSIVMAPQMGTSAIRHIHLVSMSPDQAMLIVVMNNGTVQHHLIDVDENITANDLLQIATVLNAKLSGLTVPQIRLTILKELYQELSSYKDLLNTAFELLHHQMHDSAESKIYLGGVYNILNQPEFHNIEKVKTLLSLLEQEKLLHEILTDHQESGLTVRIGVENNREEMKDCTMVTATYQLDDQVRGTVGILGPTRMEYAKVITIVQYLAERLSNALEKYK